jgi:hypothetical protein
MNEEDPYLFNQKSTKSDEKKNLFPSIKKNSISEEIQ